MIRVTDTMEPPWVDGEDGGVGDVSILNRSSPSPMNLPFMSSVIKSGEEGISHRSSPVPPRDGTPEDDAYFCDDGDGLLAGVDDDLVIDDASDVGATQTIGISAWLRRRAGETVDGDEGCVAGNNEHTSEVMSPSSEGGLEQIAATGATPPAADPAMDAAAHTCAADAMDAMARLDALDEDGTRGGDASMAANLASPEGTALVFDPEIRNMPDGMGLQKDDGETKVPDVAAEGAALPSARMSADGA